MPGQKGTNWSVLIAGSALFLTIAGSVVNAVIGGTDKLDKRVGQIENDLTWKYVNKEVAAKDFGFIAQAISDLKGGKVDKDIHEQRLTALEKMVVFQRERILELERRPRAECNVGSTK